MTHAQSTPDNELPCTRSNHSDTAVIEKILGLTRWAPSGDNTQPWRFEIRSQNHLVVHGHDTRDHCVYDLKGYGSQIAIGALLETLRIAATGQGFACAISRRTDAPDTNPTFDVYLAADPNIKPDPLLNYITERVTQRRPMTGKKLTLEHLNALERAAGPDHKVVWVQGLNGKLRVARLLYRNAYIRLTIREAYEVHRRMIQWNARFSEDRIPDQAVGLDPVTIKLMKWAMGSWPRVQFMNRWLAGTVLPRIQLDLIPGIRCAAHFAIIAPRPAQTIDDCVAGGQALQRFWLTATKLGLLLQPEITPLVFGAYVREGVAFTQSQPAIRRAKSLTKDLEAIFGADTISHAVFMGRVGAGRTPQARSLRQPLEKLLINPATKPPPT